MDFYQIKEREANKKGVTEVYPDYMVDSSEDLMIRGGKFYAVWNEKTGLWSTNELDVARLVDNDLRAYELKELAVEVHRRYLRNFGSNTWQQFRLFCTTLPDTEYDLDQRVIFKNTPVTKEDHATKKLPYAIAPGSIAAYEELVSKLYSPEERAKFEWALGAIITGEAKTIHKALVFFGKPGEGKSTIMDIFEEVLEGYTTTFEVADIVSANSQFALAQFKNNALAAIDQDGDLSKVVDNTKLNKLISHDKIVVNEKHKSQYEVRPSAMLVIGTNKPVRITDAKSGLVRRILDVRPSGELHSVRKYEALTKQVRFEFGAIAHYVVERFREMGRDYYAGYVPIGMMMETDVFFNFIEYHYDIFYEQDGCTLKQAWSMWKEWQDETRTKWDMPYHKFREELKNYFDNFEEERGLFQGARVRNFYTGFNASKYKKKALPETSDSRVMSLVLDETTSLFDELMADRLAQYSKDDGFPQLFWDNSERINKETGKPFIPKPSQIVSTKLKDLDTSKEHYVKVPEDHIVIDFDLVDEEGNKDPLRNLEAAALWPPTYAEFSKSGGGVHLHYRWTGSDNAADLSRIHSPGIEVKVYTGNSSLRRRVSRCNATPVADLASGLSFQEKKLIDPNIVATEQGLRTSIAKALQKKVHPNTKSNMDFIHHILADAYNQGIEYDVTDMRPKVMQFAMHSTNQSQTCLKMMQTMQFKSEDRDSYGVPNVSNDEIPVIFDTEVFPNLFVVCWKYSGSDSIVTMINPSASEIEELLCLKLIGFNNRGYDNHILYAASLGFNNEELYRVSKAIINNSPNAKFREAYNLSFTDIFDFAAKKQTLKLWQIELGIKHVELGMDWDKPVPEELWEKVAEYCRNDTESTDVVFKHLRGDYVAREILSNLSGLPMNATTNQHSTRIIFGEDRRPQSKFKYTDLSTKFPGYTFEYGKSTYRGEEIGEGGLVRSKTGMWTNVVLLDIESMHPTSIEILDLFGEYTKLFSELKNARTAVKNKRFDEAKAMMGGKLAAYLTDEELAEALSDALKIVVNSVYGLTAAGFENAFRDPRNIDNIVAKIGALYMLDLKYAVEEQGFTVVHIKTDSIKIAEATPEIIEFVVEHGRKFGYKFVHEATYSKMCLVNDAVYIAKIGWSPKEAKIGTWTATGAQFAHPYVFKTLFSKKPIVFRDMCEAKSVRSALWLDFEGLEDTPMAMGRDDTKHFIGKTGLFTPVISGGGTLLRESAPGEFAAANGAKGFLWLESETVEQLGKTKDVDLEYYKRLVDKAIDNISQYGDFEQFAA